MGEGFQFIDIILFAMIAAFLVLRLRSVLGRRDGHEGSRGDPFKTPNRRDKSNSNVVRLPDQGQAADDEDRDVPADGGEEEGEQDPLAAGMAEIRKTDPDFNDQDFVSGSGIAFELILNAYATGDTGALKSLLSAEVFGNFAKSIRDREQAGETMEDTLVGIKSAEIMEAYMENAVAHVTVKFVSEQINSVRDENGDVVSGDPNAVIEVTDFWTFARDLKTRDPNWILVATRSLD